MLPRCLGVVSAFPFLVQNFLLMQARNHALRPIIALFNTHSTALLLAKTQLFLSIRCRPPSAGGSVVAVTRPAEGPLERTSFVRCHEREQARRVLGPGCARVRSADAIWSFVGFLPSNQAPPRGLRASCARRDARDAIGSEIRHAEADRARASA